MDKDEVGNLDVGVFKEILETLLMKTANCLEREWPAKYRYVPNAHVVFFTRMRITINTYNAILTLVAERPPDPLRKPLLFAVSPLVRSLFEELATTLFIITDLPNITVSFAATAYTELWLEKKASEKYYGSIPKWNAYIKELDQKMDKLANQLNLTPEQIADPLKGIKRWPTPGRKMVNILKIRYPKASVIPFMEFLNAWMYRTLSGDSHLNFIAVQKRGMHFTHQFAKHVLGNDYKEILDEGFITYHKEMTWATYTILLSLVSEIEVYFGYGMKDKAKYLWTIFASHSEMAKDFHEMRYKELLG